MPTLLFRRKIAALRIIIIVIVLAGSLSLYLKGEKVGMLDYMERKCGESFTAMESYAGQLGKDYTMLKVQSRRRKTGGILVRAVNDNGKIIYQDNYLAYLLKNQIEQRIMALAEPIYGECKVFYKIPEMVFPEKFPAAMDVDAFLRHPDSMVRMYFYIRNISSDKQSQLDRLLAAFNRQGYIIGGVISYPVDEKRYRIISEDNFTRDTYLGYQYDSEAIFSMDENGNQAYLEWKE